jgi:hypothetical protein
VDRSGREDGCGRMGTWQDEPGALEWREAVDAADRLRGPGVPLRDLPGLVTGRAEVQDALRLLGDPDVPGATTAARAAVRRALRVIPQSVPDQLCYELRWRGRGRWNGPPVTCDRPTCGRCVPLKAAMDRDRASGEGGGL